MIKKTIKMIQSDTKRGLFQYGHVVLVLVMVPVLTLALALVLVAVVVTVCC